MRRPDSIMAGGRSDAAALFVFDMLAFKGKDLRHLSLLQRKKYVYDALQGAERVRPVQHVGKGGIRLYDAACALGIEEIVAKRAAAPYRRGGSSDWIKILTPAGKAVHAEREKWNGRR